MVDYPPTLSIQNGISPFIQPQMTQLSIQQQQHHQQYSTGIALVGAPIPHQFAFHGSSPMIHGSIDALSQLSIPPPPMSDACISIVTSLLCHRKGGETETFARKAIESLVKKLKDKRDELESLVAAVTSGGAQPTKCVTIPRTLDGRLQVAGRKGFPHVIYSKLWRWPDLQKNELKQAKFCQYAFDLKCESVCVNPYHYDRVVSLVSFPNNEPSSGILLHHTATPPVMLDSHPGEQQVECIPGNPMSKLSTNATQSQIYSNLIHQIPSNTTTPTSGTPTTLPTLLFPPAFSNQQSLNMLSMTSQRLLIENSNNPTRQSESDRVQHFEENQLATQIAKSQLTNISIPKLTWPEFWCAVSYFELESQVGEIFKVPSNCPQVIIDGYVDPAPGGDRFCLGRLSNIHRNAETDKVRLHIGKGIKLEHQQNGDVLLCCLSDHSVFVQSFYLDKEAGRVPGEAVHKIYPNAWLKVFDLTSCYQAMQHQAQAAKAIQSAQAAAVQGANSSTSGPADFTIHPDRFTGIGVDDLRKLCVLRLSFVKGWGPDYRRSSIKETPCWIEIQLNRALQLLDTVLHNLPQDVVMQD